MDAILVYKIYTAIKNHFVLDGYDYFRYNKRINVNYDSFMKRKDKIFFAKLGNRKKEYLEGFLVANFLHDPKMWVGELLSDESETRYKNWKKKQESISYLFTNEIDFMEGLNKQEFNLLFVNAQNEHPKIIQKYLRNEISIETLIILNDILNFIRKYDKIIDDPIYKEVSKLCKKYQPFLKLDLAKMKNILKSKLMQI